MARKPSGRKVLSWVVFVLCLWVGAVGNAACEAEAAALATAEIDLDAAEATLFQAQLDYMADPNTTTAAALATAEIDHEAAEAVRDQSPGCIQRLEGVGSAEPGNQYLDILLAHHARSLNPCPLEGFHIVPVIQRLEFERIRVDHQDVRGSPEAGIHR